MQNIRPSILIMFINFSSCLCACAQSIPKDTLTTESLSKALQIIQPKNNLGEITPTGLTLGNTNYSLRIQTIDEESLLTMPQLKVEESIQYFMPNKLVESSQILDPNALQTKALLKNLKPKDVNNNNE